MLVLQMAKNILGRWPTFIRYALEIFEYVDCAHLRVMPGDADQAFAGFAGPTYYVGTFYKFSALGIKNLVGGALGIGRIGIDRVAVSSQWQPDSRVYHVADGEDHGVHIQVGRLVGGLGGDVSLPLRQDIFRDGEPVDAACGVLMDGLG